MHYDGRIVCFRVIVDEVINVPNIENNWKWDFRNIANALVAAFVVASLPALFGGWHSIGSAVNDLESTVAQQQHHIELAENAIDEFIHAPSRYAGEGARINGRVEECREVQRDTLIRLREVEKEIQVFRAIWPTAPWMQDGRHSRFFEPRGPQEDK